MSNLEKQSLSKGQILGICEDGRFAYYFDPEEYFAAKWLSETMAIVYEKALGEAKGTGVNEGSFVQNVKIPSLDKMNEAKTEIYNSSEFDFSFIYKLVRGRQVKSSYRGQESFNDPDWHDLWEEKMMNPLWKAINELELYKAYISGEEEELNRLLIEALYFVKKLVAGWPDWRELIGEVGLER